MSIVRVLAVIVLCVVLGIQAQRSQGLRYRRWSMILGATAFGVLAVGNIVQLVGVNTADYAVPLVGLPMLLMLGSVVLFGLSWRTGERQSEVIQARRDLADEIKRRSGKTDA